MTVFFAIAQLFGAFGSHWYGHLIGNGTDRNSLFVGYLVGAGAMILGGLAAIIFGVNAEGKPLEEVAKPLSVIGKPSEAIFRTGAGSHVIDPAMPQMPHMRHRGTTGTPNDGTAPGSVPDPRASKHDDPARTRPDDGTPLT